MFPLKGAELNSDINDIRQVIANAPVPFVETTGNNHQEDNVHKFKD